MMLLLSLWIPLGPCLLVACLGQDAFLFFKLLCDYKDEGDVKEEKIEDDNKEDKIVMYNEIFQVLQLVQRIYQAYQKERKTLLDPL